MFKIQFKYVVPQRGNACILFNTDITVNSKKAGNLALIFKKEAALEKKTISKSTSFSRSSTRYFEIGGNEKRKCVN